MNYYLGMHRAFDSDKYQRDALDAISGIELCNFNDLHEIKKVRDLVSKREFLFGIHFPLYQGHYRYRDPLVNAAEPHEVEEAFIAVEKEILLAKSLDATYLLIHFPKPMILESRIKENFNFSPHEILEESDITYDAFKHSCVHALERLSELSTYYDLPIVLELDFISKWIYKETWFEETLRRLNNLTLCLDSARMMLQEVFDDDFRLTEIVNRYSEFTTNLHISTYKINGTDIERHCPVLPDLDTGEGWADVGPFITALRHKEKIKHVLFEHQTDHLTESDVMSCYDSVRKLLHDEEDAQIGNQ